MIELQTKYITLDDFKNYFGIDLEAEMNDSDNLSNNGLAFLKRIENRMETFLNAEFYRNIDIEYPKFTEYQKEHYKRALLEQALYVYKNGDISVDSGLDLDKGEVVSRETIRRNIIGENAQQELILCGLWCRKIKNRGFDNWFDGWWY